MSTLPRRRASVLCVVGGRALLVGLREPASGETLWFPPGGAIEAGESPIVAAEREALEETGYAVRCVEPAHWLEYPFRWGAKTFSCETFFYDASLQTPESSALALAPVDPLVVAVDWIAVETLAELFRYPDPLRGFLLERYAALATSRKLIR